MVVIVVAAIIAGAYLLGMKSGADLVRNGLIANYPTIKNVVQGTQIEVDSVTDLLLLRSENEDLFALLKGEITSDTLQVSIPYYGRYGVSLGGAFRALKGEDGVVEVWTPAITLRYCELKFDGLLVNGKSVSSLNAGVKKKLYEFLIPKLAKNKGNVKAAKLATTKALMFCFIPYKFDLRVYIDSQLQDLPIVPGVNQSVDDAIKQAVGK